MPNLRRSNRVAKPTQIFKQAIKSLQDEQGSINNNGEDNDELEIIGDDNKNDSSVDINLKKDKKRKRFLNNKNDTTTKSNSRNRKGRSSIGTSVNTPISESQLQSSTPKHEQNTIGRTNPKSKSDTQDDDSSYNDDADKDLNSDNDDDDDFNLTMNQDDDSVNVPTKKSSSKKRKRTSTSSTNNSKKMKRTPQNKLDKYGPESERTCPFCNKVFSIVTGLAYHVEHQVCRKATSVNQARGAKKRNIGSIPFPKLQPGEQFVTTYGVVQVVSDDRVSSDFGETVIPDNIKDLSLKYNRKKERIANRTCKLRIHAAKLQRQRREKIKELYMKLFNQQRTRLSQHRDCDEKQFQNEGTIDENDDDDDDDKQIAADIWQQYCTLTTPRHILSNLYSRKRDEKVLRKVEIESHPWMQLGDDPLSPPDSYPERIVECILIRDERKKLYEADIEKSGEERFSKLEAAKAAVKRARQFADEMNDSNLLSNDNDDVNRNLNAHESGMKLYLKRCSLTLRYNPSLPDYACVLCGKSYQSRDGLKGHIEERICDKAREQFAKDREEQIQEIENALVEEVKPLFVVTLQVAPGEKRPPKIRKNKKLPAWMSFNKELSPIYPEIFNFIEFKRGSNNSKFMMKKWDDIGPGRKKIRKSRAKTPSTAEKACNYIASWMDVSQKPFYPQVFQYLFSNLHIKHTPSSSTAKIAPTHKSNITLTKKADTTDVNHAIQSSLPDAFLSRVAAIPYPNSPETLPIDSIPAVNSFPQSPLIDSSKQLANDKVESITMDEDIPIINENSTEVSPPKKRQRKGRSENATPKSTPAVVPIIIDVRPLLEEVSGGRYPSMKPYEGDRTGICVICMNTDNLFDCQFCSNSEHLNCLKSKIAIQEPEPDDDMMCHRCIQTVLSRRARAEKRRLRKRDESMGITNSEPDDIGTASTYIGSDKLNAEAKAAVALKREIIWNQADVDAHIASYKKCPIGGPGGLICCKSCTSAYSRLLCDTAVEMETQTVSLIGRELSELMELVNDAKDRLQQVVDTSNANDVRRSMMDQDDVTLKRGHLVTNFSGMGLMDMLNNGT